eukprot:CAMPEP_0202458002 /NCGR_PEP_ID=MMETSP1360-20130828/19301_1 /ASSEMBLY_ACC=CAM_ASM_000848 /TAXON_ID=515479 /ORGANISM="Licmophora paradoxa, Strain CCMP2313" /LENGTH=58 /DNA_ID=CAMNT_0049078301 /DNA_START=1 /DNA_END=177 /DNA_ORIENTATION=+
MNDMGVKLGERILAVSCEVPPQANLLVPHDGVEQGRLWFKEMLEPKISVLKLGKSHEP